MSAFFGSLLTRAAVLAVEALVAHMVRVVIDATLRRFCAQAGFATV
jgi:hypothetical protein